jgi:O-antigen ligase
VIAASFSVLRGFQGGAITRVGANIDGSIAPIALTIILFCDTQSLKTESGGWDALKVVSLLSCAIVLLFGMSRARVIVAGALFVIYGIQRFTTVMKKNGQLKQNGVWVLLGVFCVGVLLLISPQFQQFISPIVNRFLNEGLESMGREVEMEFAKKLFSQNKLLGAGWGKFTLQDLNGSLVLYSNHSAYMAILARGGILLAIPMFLSYASLLIGAWKIRKASGAAFALMLVFLLLSYGNAGLFNYMICSLIPLVVLDINKHTNTKPRWREML